MIAAASSILNFFSVILLGIIDFVPEPSGFHSPVFDCRWRVLTLSFLSFRQCHQSQHKPNTPKIDYPIRSSPLPGAAVGTPFSTQPIVFATYFLVIHNFLRIKLVRLTRYLHSITRLQVDGYSYRTLHVLPFLVARRAPSPPQG